MNYVEFLGKLMLDKFKLLDLLLPFPSHLSDKIYIGSDQEMLCLVSTVSDFIEL